MSPILVEAAARAIDPVAREAEFAYPLSDKNFARYVHLAAEAVLEAVGDALRLEGAQAERERIAPLWEAMVADAICMNGATCDECRDVARGWVLDALGGVPDA